MDQVDRRVLELVMSKTGDGVGGQDYKRDVKSV